MPKEYKECVQSEVSRGRAMKDAQRICAISFYKRHGKTPQQAESAAKHGMLECMKSKMDKGMSEEDAHIKCMKEMGMEEEYAAFTPEELSIFQLIDVVGPFFEVDAAVWTTAFINDLPDSCFLYIEPGGKKVDGKTEPRSLRHLPYKGSDGKLDMPHLRNAIARIPQMKGISVEKKASLQARARKLLSGQGGNPEDEEK